MKNEITAIEVVREKILRKCQIPKNMLFGDNIEKTATQMIKREMNEWYNKAMDRIILNLNYKSTNENRKG